MKNIRITLFAIIASIAISSCSHTTIVKTNNNKKIPPGQMKKLTGSKSAAPYAPGQQKKSKKKN
jgi:hypothetical protein